MTATIEAAGLSSRSESLIDKLSQKALFYKNLAVRAKRTPGMEEVADHYAEHALRFENAVALIRSGRTQEAAGALSDTGGDAAADLSASQAAAERAAARRRRMMENAQ